MFGFPVEKRVQSEVNPLFYQAGARRDRCVGVAIPVYFTLPGAAQRAARTFSELDALSDAENTEDSFLIRKICKTAWMVDSVSHGQEVIAELSARFPVPRRIAEVRSPRKAPVYLCSPLG